MVNCYLHSDFVLWIQRAFTANFNYPITHTFISIPKHLVYTLTPNDPSGQQYFAQGHFDMPAGVARESIHKPVLPPEPQAPRNYSPSHKKFLNDQSVNHSLFMNKLYFFLYFFGTETKYSIILRFFPLANFQYHISTQPRFPLPVWQHNDNVLVMSNYLWIITYLKHVSSLSKLILMQNNIKNEWLSK